MSELDKLYKTLESKNDLKTINISNYSFSETELLSAEIEDISFLKIDKILNIPFDDQKKEFIISYLLTRIKATENKYLTSRYAHLLYLLTHNIEWCKKAVSTYKDIIIELYGETENAYKCYQVISCVMTLLSFQKILIMSEIVPLMQKILLEGNDKIRLWVLTIIDNNRISIDNLVNISVAKELALSFKDYSLCNRAAELGLKFANKDKASFKNNKKFFNEILGDNENKRLIDLNDCPNNIAAPNLNQSVYIKMLEYYKEAECEEKYRLTMQKYNENKRNLRFIPICSRKKMDDKLFKEIQDHFKSIADYSTEQLIVYLIVGDELVFMPYNTLADIAKSSVGAYDDYFTIVENDINSNQNPLNYDKDVWKLFKIYNIGVKNHLHYIIGIILNAVQNKILTYHSLEKIVESKTSFGVSLTVIRSGREIEYSWFNQIDYVIKDLFLQIDNYLNKKDTDWRLIIDVLPSKFEGILRDIIGLVSGNNTKIKNNKTTEMLLEDLLREKSFKEVFDDDDLTLFQYVFTDKGLNIRNNVAHGFYKPQDYSLENAVLVFMCIMRLFKYIPPKSNI